MLETASARLSQRGEAHFGSPDKLPEVRLDAIDRAGRLAIPYTSGILIGIGETRSERIEALLALRELHERHGHLQEIIVQNFRAKPGTKMAEAPEPTLEDHLWTIAVARLLMPVDVAHPGAAEPRPRGVPAPARGRHRRLRRRLARDARPRQPRGAVARALACSPRPRRGRSHAHAAPLHLPALPARRRALARQGRARRRQRRPPTPTGSRATRAPGSRARAPSRRPPGRAARRPRLAGTVSSPFSRALARSERGADLDEADAEALLSARGPEVELLARAADARRAERSGDTVTYVVCRNINYTNVCYFRCGFCAFSKGRLAANLRGPAYLLGVDEVVRRCQEAWDRGATEVCLQGGIHPGFTGTWYLDLVRAIRAQLPDLHVHAFSPLEVWQGAATEGWALRDYLELLRDAGLGSLPGTAAEILDDEVRAHPLPRQAAHRAVARGHAHRARGRPADDLDDHVRAHRGAHQPGAPHARDPRPPARHGRLHGVRAAAVRARGGADRAQGRARHGPTFREAVVLHAAARLILDPYVPSIQASWVKLGPDGARALLHAGVNDLGGTLMNESISRAAGASHGQECPPERMEEVIRAAGRVPLQRTTLYGEAPAERVAASFAAAPLAPADPPAYDDGGLQRPAQLIRPGLLQTAHAD